MKKIVLSTLLMITVVASLFSASALAYSDLRGHWAEKEISESTFTEIFEQDEAFLPKKAITRMEFVQLLHKALGITLNYFRAPDIQEFFSDVKNETAGASALYDLVISQIIPDTDTFRPNDPLRRDEMIHYIINALKYKTNGQYALIKMMPPPFNDDNRITEAYKNDVVEAVLLKIISGRGNNMLYPGAPASRAEAVVVIQRLLDVAKNLANVDVTADAILGEKSIEMKLSITNNTNSEIVIQHASGQKFDFKLFDAAGESLYTWSADKMFLMGLTTTTIASGETVEFTEVLDGDAYLSIKDHICSMKAFITGTSESFRIAPDGYEKILAEAQIIKCVE